MALGNAIYRLALRASTTYEGLGKGVRAKLGLRMRAILSKFLIIPLPGGLKAACDTIDVILIYDIYSRRVYERAYSPRPGDVVMDVGAHVGFFTLRAAKMVGEEGLVVAVEPEPHNFSLLVKNIRLNGLGNVVAVRCALSDREGIAELHICGSYSVCHTMRPELFDHDYVGTLEVPTTTMDSLVRGLGLDRLDFIKMDVEGAELLVLRGGLETLRRFGPELAIAAYHDDELRAEVAGLLGELGYEVGEVEGYIYAGRRTFRLAKPG